MSYELAQPSSDGSGVSCIRGVWGVGVAVRPENRPVLSDGTLRLHAEGSLLPRMKVERHGLTGSTRWYAGGLREEGGAARSAGHRGLGRAAVGDPRRPLADRRAPVGRRASVRHVAADGTTIPVTPGQRAACYSPTIPQLGPQLRTLLRGITVQRRP